LDKARHWNNIEVRVMESEEIVNLGNLENSLRGLIETLNKIIGRLDRFAKIVKEIDEKEGVFRKSISKLESLNEKMLTYFDGSDVYRKVQEIEQKIHEVKFEYERKESSLREEIIKIEFDDELVDKYREDIRQFLEEKEKLVNDLIKRQEEILSKFVNKIKDELAITTRLINALNRKIESSPKKDGLKETLASIWDQAEKIKDNLPLKAEDLGKIYEKYEAEKRAELFKGLYREIRTKVLSLRRELREFAVENELIGRDEIAVLEAVHIIAHEMKKEKLELEFNKTLELLKEKIEASDEKLQNILLNLSRDGFLILTLTIE
jgi:cell division protein ZapA (FtsZ GTPase activity inhibitor)